MEKMLFNNFDLTNEEIEEIIIGFDSYIKNAVMKINGQANQDYEQIIRLEIFKTLSKNRKNRKK